MTSPLATRFSPRVLEWLAGAVAVVGLALLLLPVTPVRLERAPAAPVLPTADVPRSTLDSATVAIVATNLFSGSRRAPTERFRLPGMMAEPADAMSGTGATTVSPGALAEPSGPQLFGIVSLDGVLRALVQISADSAPRLVAEGARIGSWRVARIQSDRIALSSSSGTRIVRLSRRVSPDSSELRP